MENVTKLCQSLKHLLKMRRTMSKLYEGNVDKEALETMGELDQDVRATTSRIQRRIMRIYDLKGIALSSPESKGAVPVRESLRKVWTNMMDMLENEKLRSTYHLDKAMFKLNSTSMGRVERRI
jgi:hypothetical protein